MIYEPLFKLERTGVQIHYYTGKGKYNPVHWHSAIELIYVLNGNGSIMIDGKEYLAQDCGGAIKGNKIDIFSEYPKQERYQVEIYIKREK